MGGIYIAQHKAKCPLPYPTLEHLCLSLKWSSLWEHLCFCPPDLHLLFSYPYNSPEPYGCSSLFLFLGSLALGHLCKAVCPLCFWRKASSSRKVRERWYYILIWFFLFPSHYHSCLKLSDVNQVWPSLYFLSKNMWWPEKSPLWPRSNHSYAFVVVVVILTWSRRRWKGKASSSLPRICQYLDKSFFIENTHVNFFLFMRHSTVTQTMWQHWPWVEAKLFVAEKWCEGSQ